MAQTFGECLGKSRAGSGSLRTSWRINFNFNLCLTMVAVPRRGRTDPLRLEMGHGLFVVKDNPCRIGGGGERVCLWALPRGPCVEQETEVSAQACPTPGGLVSDPDLASRRGARKRFPRRRKSATTGHTAARTATAVHGLSRLITWLHWRCRWVAPFSPGRLRMRQAEKISNVFRRHLGNSKRAAHITR